MHDAHLEFIIAGVGVSAINFLLGWRRAGLRLEGRLLAFTVATALAGLLGARLYALIEQGRGWGFVLSPEAGLRLPGATIGLLVGLVVFRRVLLPAVPIGAIGDIGTVAVQFGMAVARLGCLTAGCCFGIVCALPWAIRFPRGTIPADVHASMGWIGHDDGFSLPVHPLQLYFMLLHLGVAVFLTWLMPRKRYDGQVLLAGVLLSEGGKAVLETLRQPIAGVAATHLQLVSAALAAAAAVALLSLHARGYGRPSRAD